MSDRTNPNDPGYGRGPEPHPDAESNLQDLRARLDELQHSVENLGTSAGWDTPPPPPAPAADYYAPPPPPYPPAPLAPPVDPYAAPPQAPPLDPYAAPPVDPYALPPQAPLADPYAPAPAATNGHGESEAETSEVSARWATVAIVEAGPFADLIELRHFEDDLSALAAVSDVRVRRFGHGRATIEVGMTGPYPLARELYQLNRPMDVSDGPEGEVLIEFAPPVVEAPSGDEPVQNPPAQPLGEAG